jgi:hypothetical protein
MIPTRYRQGDYGVTDIDKGEIVKITERTCLTLKTSQRIRNNWLPLQSIASAIQDTDWLAFSESEIERDIHAMMASQDFEPEEAMLAVLNEEMLKSVGSQDIEMDVTISDLKNTLRHHYDLKLKSF